MFDHELRLLELLVELLVQNFLGVDSQIQPHQNLLRLELVHLDLLLELSDLAVPLADLCCETLHQNGNE